MDSGDDAPLRGLASGDTYPTTALEPAPLPVLKRDHDSTDDFEHLDSESKPEGESPHHPRTVTQSFLDMERDVFVEPGRASSLADKLDHIADKFTDSESDADTAGESPLHRPAPPVPAPLVDLLAEQPPAPASAVPLTPVPAKPVTLVAEQPAPAPAPASDVPAAPVAKVSEAAPPAPTKPAAAAPQQPPPPPPVSLPAADEPARAPIAHVIEAEVIFCQMGLGKLFIPI